MSFAGACPRKGHDHVVLQRESNQSAFNGYHRTPSAYSHVQCLQTLDHWRTKAGYVRQLRDATDEEARNPHLTPQHIAYLKERS